ncbi:signal recognition particle-docking protein FtsY [Demequina aurantiaca]|uniref:signal recognition particle-docking protein FtsY n=1 Tax=Demequina aurantiaca TaxID=676200 RepID=UPI000780490D|nr:signal recognition particle-docking protein FtsY [Demequina aurantiaca]
MDISWIPGDQDAIVAAIAGVAILVAGAAVFVTKSRDRRDLDKFTPPAKPSDDVTTPPAGAEAPSGTAPAQPDVQPPAPKGDRPEDPDARFARLRSRLGGGLGAGLLSIFGRGKLDANAWDELEETLLLADVGPAATDDILAALKTRLTREPDVEPKRALHDALLDIVDPTLDRSLSLGTPGAAEGTTAIVVGVNGVGKTTTVGKIARVLVAEDYSVVLGAADTFRAAAADQLETWGSRVGVPVVRSHKEGADPASVAFEAADKTRTDGADVLLVDTAGRLQNKAGLMDELGKIVRVVSKVRPPSEVLLVLDATTGQNGLSQARIFGEVAPLTGIILTKMDGTAKGGIVIAVQRELGVPVKFLGLGEGVDDLAPFDPQQFVDGLLGE